ncbi:MAG: tetraacyldisaccharide 4'-kinase [Candidatus Omnitrophica bacterium]|nr:tetraacyldisaccharide 4'-kinase [Candidatus Omnitrophota bacterium]MDE2009119.1 tetraacyldisaccharide 4'-kinase [Candidatus Omnitrophota bacterium]MDE2214216.1 tetraacyldisaccharide 4'-kinase [Candidatus Omnitrophota bacterium]MDE2231253.1 tetraacyldisaccharide 4'-kinase [Candidatus Omnitrophota bacterium]
MNRYLLSIMKGRQNSFTAQLIMYLLLPWSFLYGLGVVCHRNLCRLQGIYRAPKPVISIGNITVGGTGKTPLVIWLVKGLQNKGIKSIVLIRGYKPHASRMSDEVDMLNEQIPYVPVLAGADRSANIREAEKTLPADVYICDDAFQHWPLHRDLNLVTIDAGNPFGNGYLLPAGILREGLSALKRADVFMLTKTDGPRDIQNLIARLQRINPKALIMESRYKSSATVDAFDALSLPEDFLSGKRVAGFCAIGDPLSFELSLRNSGADVVKMFEFMDHHAYRAKDIRRMVQFCCTQNIWVLVTTHKDMVKLRSFKNLLAGIRLVYIPVQIEITKGADEFFQKVFSLCRR